MARTPLMRASQRIAWEHRAASQLGIGVEQLREREMSGVSRREFLKRAGAVGAAAAVVGPLPLARPARAAATPRIAAIAVNSDGSVNVSFADHTTITADHVILCMSFAVLRTLNYKKAGFDSLKQTAITQLGSGRNVKLNLQFNSRPWNASGSTGSLYSDQSFQSTWDVTRGQGGTTGIQKAAPPKASAPPTRSSPTSRCSNAQPRSPCGRRSSCRGRRGRRLGGAAGREAPARLGTRDERAPGSPCNVGPGYRTGFHIIELCGGNKRRGHLLAWEKNEAGGT
jgi:hypothetical protein